MSGKRKRLPVADYKPVLRAYYKCMHRLTDPELTSTTSSAGFLLTSEPDQPAEGWQVFVKVIRYSDAKLKNDPMSGGLAVEP